MEEIQYASFQSLPFQNIPIKNNIIKNTDSSNSQNTRQFSKSSDSLQLFSLSSSNTTLSDDLSDVKNNDDHKEQCNSVSKRKYFTKEEDHLLTIAAMAYNQGSWNKIAKRVPGKTPKQCRDRWVNYLQPSLKFSPWTDHEDQLLVSLVNKLGTHWTKMKTYFPNRSTNCLKNRWYWLAKNRVKTFSIQKSLIYANNGKPSPNGQFPVNHQNINLMKLEPKNNIQMNNQYILNNTNSNSTYAYLNVDQQKNNQYYYLLQDKGKKKKSMTLKQKQPENEYNQKIIHKKEKNISHLKCNKIEEEFFTFSSEELEW